MRKIGIILFFASIYFSYYSCTSVEKDLILGKWQAVSVTEKGVELNIPTEDVQLNFLTSTTYTYQSTLRYRESGSYHLDNKYLYTIDTLNQASKQKAVEILLLSEDSLHLKMMEANEERVLKMVKIP